MSAKISIGFIRIASATNAVGVFTGQNMQSDWDSHAPFLAAMGGILGSNDFICCQYATIQNQSELGQAVIDKDAKQNNAKLWIGP
jgi:hypothetical protein